MVAPKYIGLAEAATADSELPPIMGIIGTVRLGRGSAKRPAVASSVLVQDICALSAIVVASGRHAAAGCDDVVRLAVSVLLIHPGARVPDEKNRLVEEPEELPRLRWWGCAPPQKRRVTFEPWVECEFLLSADHDPAVVGIAFQPPT